MINTNVDVLAKINELVEYLQESGSVELANELKGLFWVLYKEEALSIGVLVGIKSIVLNKYLLPVTGRNGVYEDFKKVKENFKELETPVESESLLNKSKLKLMKGLAVT